MWLREYAKVKVPVSRKALKTNFQNVSNLSKGTNISSSTKICYFFSQKRKQIKTPGKSTFPSSLMLTSIRRTTNTKVSEILVNMQHCVHKATDQNQRPRISWTGTKSTETTQQPSRRIRRQMPATRCRKCNWGTQGDASK